MQMNTIAPSAEPRWKAALNMIINPGEIVKNQMSQIPWPYSLSISGLSFSLFFMQTGLDLFRAGQAGTGTIVLLTLLGLLYGTAGIALVAVMVWALAQAAERNITMEWAISAFALGYSATFIYAVSGLIFSLALGWRTAVAFGVTGVLWALRPTMYTIKQMSGDKLAFSIAMTTLCGAIILLGWTLVGKIGGV